MSETRFAVVLKQLPGVSHIEALELINASEEVVDRIENRPGKMGSLAIYNHLGLLYGAITPEAARKGLELFSEHVADARENPGKHPNIDRLMGLVERDETLRVKHVFAV
ncbi:MAG TPA: DUF2322 family protein [Azoarcus sp.]|nr:DUF2322 family protein [Azoarcus sp.]